MIVKLENVVYKIRNLLNLVDVYSKGEKESTTYFAISKMDYHIRKLGSSVRDYPFKELSEDLNNLLNEIYIRTRMLDRAMDIVKSMSNLDHEPILDVCQMVYAAELDILLKKLKKSIKKLAIQYITEKTYSKNPEIDIVQEDEVETNCDDNIEQGISTKLLLRLSSGGPDDNVFLDSNNGYISAKISSVGKRDYITITQTTSNNMRTKYKYEVKDMDRTKANDIVHFINSFIEPTEFIFSKRDMILRYGMNPILLTEDPDIKHNGSRLSIYLEIVTDHLSKTIKGGYAFVYDGYGFEIDTDYNASVINYAISNYKSFSDDPYNQDLVMAGLHPLYNDICNQKG